MILSNRDEESNESGKRDTEYVAQQGMKEKILVFRLVEEKNYAYCWKFNVARLKEAKLSRNKKIKVHYFHVEKLKIYNYLKEKPDNIIHISTNAGVHLKLKN